MLTIIQQQPEGHSIDFTIVEGLQTAFNFFNLAIFNNDLPPTVITLQRGKKFRGYFMSNAFGHRKQANLAAHEIAMNPDEFVGRDDRSILSTLVHEMAHHWQQIFGKPGKGGYHNKEWAHKMIEIGLQPVSIDRPGEMIGRRVTHDIIPNDTFDNACTEFLSSGYYLVWESRTTIFKRSAKKRKPSKVAYTCPVCDAKVWGKPGLSVLCGECQKSLDQQEIA